LPLVSVGVRNYRYFYLFLININVLLLGAAAACLSIVIMESNASFSLIPLFNLALAITFAGISQPVLNLLCYHFKLVYRGISTNEELTGKPTPEAKASLLNCFFCCLQPQYPSMLHRNRHLAARWQITRRDVRRMAERQSKGQRQLIGDPPPEQAGAGVTLASFDNVSHTQEPSLAITTLHASHLLEKVALPGGRPAEDVFGDSPV